MIGHGDPRTTKAICGHLFPDSRATITGKLDACLGGLGGVGMTRVLGGSATMGLCGVWISGSDDDPRGE